MIINAIFFFRFVNIVMSVLIFLVMYTLFRKLSRRLKVISISFLLMTNLHYCRAIHFDKLSFPLKPILEYINDIHSKSSKSLKLVYLFISFQDDPGLGIQPIHRTCCMMNSLVLTCFPLLYFYNLLYYTDVGSVLFVITSYSCSSRGHHFKSAMVRILVF